MLWLAGNIRQENSINKSLETLVPQGFLETFGHKDSPHFRPKVPRGTCEGDAEPG
jgi:hypothetical protein